MLEDAFPNLQAEKYEIKSPEDECYNCVAWAANETHRWWWPISSDDAYWPAGVERVNELRIFIRAFQIMGYEVCDLIDFQLEPGVEKVAIYADEDGRPTHMARQLEDGQWTSKLGDAWDIVHSSPSDLHGNVYGQSAVVMRRVSAR